MSEVSPNPPGEGRHEALPPKAHGPWRTLFIVLAIIVVLAIIATLLWFFVFSKGTGGNPTNPPTSSAPTEPPVTPPPLTACETGDITVTLGSEPSVGAGRTQVPINFANSGSESCTLEGYPNVTMIWQDGGPLMPDATQDTVSAPVTSIIVNPGGPEASALLTIGSAADTCPAPLTATGFQVTLPGATEPVMVDASGYTGCGDGTELLFEVSAIAGGGD